MGASRPQLRTPLMVAKIDAINRMLTHIQLRPVQSLEEPLDPIVAQAKLVLEQVSLDLQQMGWEWLRESERQFDPDSTTNEISIPDEVIAIDFDGLRRAYKRITVRGGKLYNATDRTYEFTDSVKLNVIVTLDFEDLPHAAQQASMWAAARELFTAVRGDGPQLASLAANERKSYAEMRAQDIRNTDAMISDSTLVAKTIARRRARWTWVR